MMKDNLLALGKADFGKKLLFLSYYFPPIHVNSIVRIRHFFEGFKENDFDITVVTGKFPKSMPIDLSLKIPKTRIFYIHLWGIRLIFSRLISKNLTIPIPWKKNSIFSILLSWRNRTPFQILMGDGGLFYVIQAYFKSVQIIKNDKITTLFTSYSPMADHLTAFLLKTRFPSLHWIGDFRDLPSDDKSPNPLNYFIHVLFMRKLLSKVNVLTTVSQGLTKPLSRYQSNIEIYSGCITSEHIYFQKSNPNCFVINYTGSIYPKFQELSPIIQVMLELISEGKIQYHHIHWRYCGIHTEQFRQWLHPHFKENQLTLTSLISFTDSQKNQRDASINLLLTWNTDFEGGILTTKLFEYLAAGRPILSWTNGKPDSEMNKILEIYQNGGDFQKGKETEMKMWIHNHYNQWINQKLAYNNPNKIMELYSESARNEKIKKVSAKTPTRKNT